MEYKFQYGDLIIGNEKSNSFYGTTTKGTKWIIIKEYAGIIHICSEKQWMRLQESKKYFPFTDVKPTAYIEFDVRADCFNFVKSTINTSNKAMAYVLQNYDD